jgi:hypothetical protein
MGYILLNTVGDDKVLSSIPCDNNYIRYKDDTIDDDDDVVI